MGWGNKILIERSRSHDQDGHHAHTSINLKQNHLL